MMVPLDLRVPIFGRGSPWDRSSPLTDDDKESGVVVDVQFWSRYPAAPEAAASVAVGVVDDGDGMLCCEHVWKSQLAVLLILTPTAWQDERRRG